MPSKLSVDPPYHFGWKLRPDESNQGLGDQGYEPDGTHQEIDLDKQTTDIMLYKGKEAVGWWKIIKRKNTNE